MFGQNNNFSGLSGMLNVGNNSINQLNGNSLRNNLNNHRVRRPVRTMKDIAKEQGLDINFNRSTRRDIRQDNRLGYISDPVQYTIDLINKTKTKRMSDQEKMARQPVLSQDMQNNYLGISRDRLPLGTSMNVPTLPKDQQKSLNRGIRPFLADIGIIRDDRNPNQRARDTLNPPMIEGANLPDDNSSFFGGGEEMLYPDIENNNLDNSQFNEWDSSSYADTGTGMPEPYTGDYDNSRSTNPNMIDAYSEDWMSDFNTGNVPTAEELRASGINMNKLRNAIATGVIDPYNLGVNSGIPFTYDQLKGIEQGQAQSMDPAISDIQARIATADKRETSDGGLGYSFGSNPSLDVILGSGKFTKDQKNLIIQSIQSGSDPTTVILNQAKNIMGGPESSAVTKSEQALNSMKELDSLLKQFYSSGGKSNLLSGKYENVLNKLGTLRDPNLASIGVSIAIALQKYRNAVSGTAFSVQEGQEMKAVFPSISNTQGLNDVITKSRLNALQSDVDTAYRGVLGSAYDSLRSNNVSGSTGQTRNINGVEYQLNPTDNRWYPLTKVGGGTNSATKVNSLQDAMRRIARNESDGSGGYKAVGPVVTKGMYRGQRALGKYQVMQGNVGPWSKEILGYSVTPQQFYNDPALQEKIVSGKMNQIYKKYGNWSDVASVWFTGQPLSRGANSVDVLGTTGAQYVNKFLS